MFFSRLQQRGISPWEVASLALVLIAYAILQSHVAARTGVTIDEPSHILSSILYWEGNDNLLPQDMPPLVKIVGGLAAGDAGFRIPEESHVSWERRHEWFVSLDMMRRMGERRIRQAMYRVRMPMLIFPIATFLLLWWWARQLYSALAGLFTGLVFLLEPTSLGHAALFKNDHASAFGYLLFWFTAWRYWRAPSIGRAAWMGVGMLLAVLAKLSMVVLGGVLVAVLIWKKADWKSVAAPFAILYAGTIIACQFKLAWAFGILPVAGPIWDGVWSLAKNASGENSVYLLGEIRPYGHWAYFLVAAAVKSPEIVLLLLTLGFCQLKHRFLLAPLGLYFILASASPLQFGFRLVMPCLPIAALITGGALAWIERRKWLLAVVAILLILPAVRRYPHYLSYFNDVSGGPQNGLTYLSDSNVDWGQDLRELRSWMQRNKVLRVHMSYLGPDNLLAYFRPDQYQMLHPPFTEEGKKTKQIVPQPGVYAISANLITGQFFEKPWRDAYLAFRKAKPIDYAGYSIYIYRFP